MRQLRVVFDTNCLISALIFNGVMSSKLRYIWQNAIAKPVICPETQSELQAVLSYPKFALSAKMQNMLLEEVLAYCEKFPSIQPIEEIPGLVDPKDAMFIYLAQKAKTDFLVSGDKHILNLQREFPELHILPPAQFLDSMAL